MVEAEMIFVEAVLVVLELVAPMEAEAEVVATLNFESPSEWRL